ncbi:MAG: 50S ribosomal protein L3, partial [Candidatus Pacearchaeota archaeon]|nr:50S ribosomal protein L3 [Candidatus Pacearchaeota archaeon]
HPAHVTFRTPMSGQLGMFTRVHYNLKIIDSGKISEKNINKKQGFKRYGNINSSYIILKGSVQGPAKRQVLLTQAMRPTKKQTKKKFELMELK